jgi:hypothetical protein
VTFPGGTKEGCVSVTVVNGDKIPMVPGFGQQPRFIVTIQPAGAVFNPPAPMARPLIGRPSAASLPSASVKVWIRIGQEFKHLPNEFPIHLSRMPVIAFGRGA